MNKFKPNLPLTIGLIIYTAALGGARYWSIPEFLHNILLISALILELWGIILLIRSPEMKNSKLRRFKLRLIGREPK